jgi:thiol-disulfide isomerase/thioredoxin
MKLTPRSIVWGAPIALVLAAFAATAQGPSPGEQEFKRLLAEWNVRSSELNERVRAAKSDEEKEAANKNLGAERRKYAEALHQLAQKHPNDPSSVDALLGALKIDPSLEEKTLAGLAKDHVKDPKMAKIGFYLGVTLNSAAAEKLLREILAQHPDRAAQGNACYGLGRLFYKRYLDDTTAKDAARHAQEAERFFQRQAEMYADVPLHHLNDKQWAFAEVAEPRLFELRHLIAGKVAPEIAGEDIDGKMLKLSDFRGKIVVLNFWGTWCPPCIKMIPKERELVKRFEGQPFALLGVANDYDRERVKKAIESKGITWRSWWDGGENRSGPIAETWRIVSWPRLYILDHRGVIRHTGDEGLTDRTEALVEALLKELAAERRKGE